MCILKNPEKGAHIAIYISILKKSTSPFLTGVERSQSNGTSLYIFGWEKQEGKILSYHCQESSQSSSQGNLKAQSEELVRIWCTTFIIWKLMSKSTHKAKSELEGHV